MSHAYRRGAVMSGLLVLAMASTGCVVKSSASDTTSSDGASVDALTELRAFDLQDLLPTDREVQLKLGWVPQEQYESPVFDQLPADAAELIDAYGGPLSLGVDCADALTGAGVIPGFPLGADEYASHKWVERDVTVREMVIARYPTIEQAAAQVDDALITVDACPFGLGVAGGRNVFRVSTDSDEVIAYQADDSYTYLRGARANVVAQIEVGTGPEELASGLALLELQMDKLDLVSRGEYTP